MMPEASIHEMSRCGDIAADPAVGATEDEHRCKVPLHC
jgi:hypothetical protein